MALEPNIALQAGQGVAAPPNPMDQLGRVVGIANAVGQNKLMGQALQTQQQALAATRLRVLGGIAATALSQSDPNNPDTLVHALHLGIDGAVKNGVIDQGTAQHLFEGIANTASPGELVGRVKQFALMGLEPNAALSRVYGENATMSNGQDVQPGVFRNPMFGGGFTASGPAVPQFPSRSELAGRVPGPAGANGEPTTVPLGTVTPPNLAGPAASPMGNGRGNLPPALRNPANPPAPAAAAPNGQVTTGLGPAQSAALSQTGGQSATRFQEIADAGTQALSQDAILSNMEAESDQFTTGIGAERFKKFSQAAVRFAPGLARAFGVDEKSVAANESFDKLAAQIADAQGAKSDARLAVTQNANPSSSLSPEGVRLILRQLRGNADYLRARQTLAAQWPNRADHQGFEQEAKNLDPRAFQLLRMTPEQRTAYFTKLSPSDRDAIKRAWAWTQERGLVPGGQ